MSGLAPQAAAQVTALGLRAVCDLRRNAERASHPNPDFGDSVRRFEWDTMTESSPIRDRAFAGTDAADVAHAAMIDMYEQLPFKLQSRLAGVFAALEHACDGATIVHCMAGKDRTGVAIALVLAALGVRREAIIEDYVLTNSAVDLRAQLVGRQATGRGARNVRRLAARAVAHGTRGGAGGPARVPVGELAVDRGPPRLDYRPTP